ncbi:Rv2175c family DNA-binding protein [Demequina sp.]|uniref:Rv2175c family DNA-binding protein n=1 Tax=Demequina sp. TaxID=2050685 RepID=UPI003A877734
MSEEMQWLTVPDFADALGVEASDVRELIRTGQVIAVRRGPSNTWQIPGEFIVEDEDGPRLLPTLVGTLTVLSDAGLGDDEAIEWLSSVHEELGESPLAALRSGKRAPVRRAAQTLF